MGEALVYLSRTAPPSNMAAREGRHFAFAAGLVEHFSYFLRKVLISKELQRC